MRLNLFVCDLCGKKISSDEMDKAYSDKIEEVRLIINHSRLDSHLAFEGDLCGICSGRLYEGIQKTLVSIKTTSPL